MEINKKYTFIHPTKTGGTACKKFLESKYSEYFTGFEHNILLVLNIIFYVPTTIIQ